MGSWRDSCEVFNCSGCIIASVMLHPQDVVTNGFRLCDLSWAYLALVQRRQLPRHFLTSISELMMCVPIASIPGHLLLCIIDCIHDSKVKFAVEKVEWETS